MPNYYYTSDEIVKSVKRRIVMPTSQNLFTDQDLLDFATEEMNMAMVPMIQSQQEDYFLYTQLIDLIPGQTKYPIPYRATGNKLREVSFQSSAGNVLEMTRIGVGDLPFYNQSSSSNQVYAYYVENNQICLVPEGGGSTFSGQLRFTYYIRPNTMVPLEEVASVTSVNLLTGVITFSSLPEKYFDNTGNLNPDLLVDFVMVESPHKTLKFDVLPLSADRNAKTITFTPSDIPSTLRKGDQVCKATESAIPQIPSDLHVMLAHRVATRVLEAIGDTEGLQNANQKLVEMEKRAADLIDDRVEDSPRKLVNRHSILRGGLSSRRFRG